MLTYGSRRHSDPIMGLDYPHSSVECVISSNNDESISCSSKQRTTTTASMSTLAAEGVLVVIPKNAARTRKMRRRSDQSTLGADDGPPADLHPTSVSAPHPLPCRNELPRLDPFRLPILLARFRVSKQERRRVTACLPLPTSSPELVTWSRKIPQSKIPQCATRNALLVNDPNLSVGFMCAGGLGCVPLRSRPLVF
jgi:hypothetical protein